jgi:hypothetical protein
MARRTPPLEYIADLAIVLGTAALFAFSTATARVHPRDTPSPAPLLTLETGGEIAASVADRGAWEAPLAARPATTGTAGSRDRAVPAPNKAAAMPTQTRMSGEGPPTQQLLHSRPDNDARAYLQETAAALQRRAWISELPPRQNPKRLGTAWIGHADDMRANTAPAPRLDMEQG